MKSRHSPVQQEEETRRKERRRKKRDTAIPSIFLLVIPTTTTTTTAMTESRASEREENLRQLCIWDDVVKDVGTITSVGREENSPTSIYQSAGIAFRFAAVQSAAATITTTTTQPN